MDDKTGKTAEKCDLCGCRPKNGPYFCAECQKGIDSNDGDLFERMGYHMILVFDIKKAVSYLKEVAELYDDEKLTTIAMNRGNQHAVRIALHKLDNSLLLEHIAKHAHSKYARVLAEKKIKNGTLRNTAAPHRKSLQYVPVYWEEMGTAENNAYNKKREAILLSENVEELMEQCKNVITSDIDYSLNMAILRRIVKILIDRIYEVKYAHTG